MSTQTSTSLRAADGFRPVDAFERPATFVAKDRAIHLLDAQSTDAPKPCYTLSETSSDASDIAVMHRGAGFFVGFDKTFYQFRRDGQLVETFDLEQIGNNIPSGKAVPGYEAIGPEQLNWRIEASESNRQLFFTWLTKGTEGAHIGRLELEARRVDWVPVKFGYGIAFDTSQGIVYETWPHENRGIYVGRFDVPTSSPQHWPTEGAYLNLALSPDSSQLLASEGTLDASSPQLAMIDTSTGAEHVLDFAGSDAAWGADGRIWFHGHANSLWTATKSTVEPERILWSTTETNGGFQAPPVLASNGEWLAWSFLDEDKPRLVLLDIVTQTYRILYPRWPLVQLRLARLSVFSDTFWARRYRAEGLLGALASA
jgi:hypothetical protein